MRHADRKFICLKRYTLLCYQLFHGSEQSNMLAVVLRGEAHASF